jgi:hypothetical protein
MKSWKKRIFNPALIGMVAIIAFGFAFVACDDGNEKDEDQPEFRDNGRATPTLDGIEYSVKVEGTLTKAEYDAAISKIVTLIEREYNAITGDFLPHINFEKNKFKNLFGDENTVIILEKTTEYNKYKVIDEFRTLYLNVDYLNNLSSDEFYMIMEFMLDNPSGEGWSILKEVFSLIDDTLSALINGTIYVFADTRVVEYAINMFIYTNNLNIAFNTIVDNYGIGSLVDITEIHLVKTGPEWDFDENGVLTIVRSTIGYSDQALALLNSIRNGVITKGSVSTNIIE